MQKRFLLFLLAGYWNAYGQLPFRAATPALPATTPSLPVIGILGAFPDEITLLLTQVQRKQERMIQGIRFTEGILRNQRVVVALTGMGKVNSAMATTLLLEHFRPREVIFTGIAGGVNPALQPGDMVIGSRIAHHDYGTLTPDSLTHRPTRNPFTLQENPLYYPSDSVLVDLAQTVARSFPFEPIATAQGNRPPRIVSGVIVTGDVFVASKPATQQLRNQMHAEATEMEGASIAQICWQQHVPFLIIRSLSDDAGNQAYDDVKKFYQLAARNSAQLVMALVEAIQKKSSWVPKSQEDGKGK